mgnify:CR=1 FL=1
MELWMIYRVAVDTTLEKGDGGHVEVNLHDTLFEAVWLLRCHGGGTRKFRHVDF